MSTAKAFDHKIIYRIHIYIFHYIGNCNHLWYLNIIFNNTPLIMAAYGGHTETVQELLAQDGIDINFVDIWNQEHL